MGNCQQFINQNSLQQQQQQIVIPSITVETTELKQQTGFPKRPIGVQAPQFSGTCFVNGGLSQKSLKDYNGKFLIILFYCLEEQQTFEELISIDYMYQQFLSRNTEIIVIIDEKIDRIKSQLLAHIKKPTTPNPMAESTIAGSQIRSTVLDQVNLKFGIFGDPEGKIFLNFKVPINNQNDSFRYKAVYILDKMGIIQYLNIHNSNIKCDPRSMFQILTNIQETPLSKQLSLFERIGGSRILIEAVELFYNELPNNPFLEEHFRPLNIRNMKNKQAEYFNYLFRLPIGGQKDLKLFTTMKGINISDSHKNLSVPVNIYEIYIRTFNRIFLRLDVDQQTVQEIYERFQFIKPMIFPNLVNQKSTFDLLGSSSDAIALFVDILYNRILADPQLGPFFKGMELNKLKSVQKQFFQLAFGGPSTYETKKLKESHLHLKLNDHHFETFVDCICESLAELRIPLDQIAPIRKQFQSIRNIFVQNGQQIGNMNNSGINNNNNNNNLMQSVVSNCSYQQDTFQQTLYYRIGGKLIVDQLLATFKQQITNDPRVNYLFKGEQAMNQIDIYDSLQLLMGGQSKHKQINGSPYSPQRDSECSYSQMKGLPIKVTDQQFSQLKLHLLSSARTQFIDFEKVVEIGQVYESLRGVGLYIIPQKTIYEQFGGENGVLSSVNIFYEKLQFDYRLNILFKTIPIQMQKQLFYALISFCVGSTNQQIILQRINYIITF